MDKLRIGIVTSNFFPSEGGIAAAHYNLYLALKGCGHVVKSFSYLESKKIKHPDSIQKGTPALVLSAMKLINFLYFKLKDKHKDAYQTLAVYMSALGTWRLNRAIRNFRPNILIVQDQGSPLLFINKPKDCKIIWMSHHNSSRMKDNPLYGEFSQEDARQAVHYENKALRKADAAICSSRYMKEVFLQTYNFSKPIFIAPNIIDDAFVESIQGEDIREKLGLERGSIMICIPTAGSKFKGARFVPEIIRRINENATKPVGFYLSGKIPNDLKYELSLISSKIPLYMPETLGWKQHIAVFKRCDFVVYPTLLDNLSMALIETNYCGLPAVTLDVGGNRDIIEHGENGFVADYLDIDQIINYSVALFDDELRAKMSENARRISIHKFSSKAATAQYLDIFKELCQS